jgi:hypothetical protein
VEKWRNSFEVEYLQQTFLSISCVTKMLFPLVHRRQNKMLKIAAFLDVPPRSLVEVQRRFRGSCYLHLQILRISRARTKTVELGELLARKGKERKTNHPRSCKF